MPTLDSILEYIGTEVIQASGRDNEEEEEQEESLKEFVLLCEEANEVGPFSKHMVEPHVSRPGRQDLHKDN